MTNLVIAALFLPLSHFLISSTVLCTILVRRLGEGYFALAYSLVALGAFAWLIMAYRHAS
jgi:NnrU protein